MAAVTLATSPRCAFAQEEPLQEEPLPESAAWAVQALQQYRVVSDVTYLTANTYDSKLDVYLPRASGYRPRASEPVPTLVYIHGGGWVGGSKEFYALWATLPYMEKDMAVVNVEYRLAKQTLAPGAVEDVRCALRWVYRNADRYNFDTEKIVVAGHSAGGHLALMTGMLTQEAGLDRRCPRRPQEDSLGVAAVINFFGITDVPDLLEGENRKTYAVSWLGSQPDRMEIARRVSPLRYVRAGLPPILTIHGDSDPIVPYQHAVRLHEALDEAGVPGRLLTIPEGGHGGFSGEQTRKAYRTIWAFLRKNGILE